MYENSFNRIGYNLCAKNGYEWNEKLWVVMERLLNIFMVRYDLEDIPEEYEHLYGNRNLYELMLFFSPAVAWFRDSKEGLMSLPVSGTYKYNAAGKPVEWTAYAINGAFAKELNEENSVLMFNDQAMSIPYLQLLYEARFLIKLDSAMNQNIDLQSTPYVIEAFDDNVKSSANWVDMLKRFASRVVIRKKRDKDTKNDLLQSQVLNTNVELKIDQFMKAYNEFLFRAHTYMGIKNVNIEKSERLLTGEVSANDILVQSNYTNCLNMRQKAFDEMLAKGIIDKKITVKPTDLKTMTADISSMYQAVGQGMFKGGVNNGSKDNATQAN